MVTTYFLFLSKMSSTELVLEVRMREGGLGRHDGRSQASEADALKSLVLELWS